MGIRKWIEDKKQKKLFRQRLESSYLSNLDRLDCMTVGSPAWEMLADLVKHQEQQLTALECSKMDAKSKVIGASVPAAIGVATLGAKAVMWHKEYRLERQDIDDAEIALLRSPHNHDKFRP